MQWKLFTNKLVIPVQLLETTMKLAGTRLNQASSQANHRNNLFIQEKLYRDAFLMSLIFQGELNLKKNNSAKTADFLNFVHGETNFSPINTIFVISIYLYHGS